ncbi:MAG: M23 family metallopeptidase [Myxococcaceae bacterium]|nr:M23 family metallopeptidase [Myxococcaceae bacterium]
MTELRPAFMRPRRGLLDFVLVALCLWAAGYHTPLGALVRSTASWLTGVRTSAQPLLAYYTGGVYGAGEAGGTSTSVPKFRAPPSPREALAWGVHAVVGEQPPERWVVADAVAARFGQPRGRWREEGPAVERTRRVLDALVRELGAEEAAVVAFFYGESVARFAVRRVRASGEDVVLGSLRRHLPPGQEDALALASRALMLGTVFSLRWPVVVRAPITSPFGVREHPVLGGTRPHTGVDIGLPIGTQVRAVAAGRVLRASEDAVNGRLVVLDHGRGVTTAYLHNSALRVEVGDEVEAGQVLALSGNTGLSSGPHLHYQLELAGEPVDPLRFRTSGATVLRSMGSDAPVFAPHGSGSG